MAVEHRGIGVDPQAVRGAMHFEPAILAHFSLEDFIVNAIVENLRPAAGHASQAGFAQGDQHLADAQMRDPGQVNDLDGGERLDVQLRALPADAGSMSR